ncbi:hypothetical protein [Rhizobium giardinii]|uniref:hypothetical protein n=1 Tax=Rhizobium giardinii TaxID=56731 RepID=UPI003D6F80CC
MSPDNQFSAEKRVVLAGELFKLHGDADAILGTVTNASGIGSGMVFTKDGPTGYVFEIDALKTVATQTMVIAKKVRDEFDCDTETLLARLSNPERLSTLRDIVADHIGIDDEQLRALLTTVIVSAPGQKDHLILDVTLQDLRQLETLARVAKTLG